MNTVIYAMLGVLSLISLLLCLVVVFWIGARLCNPLILLLVAGVALQSSGLLLSAAQRLAQHASLTLGLAPLVLGQLIAITALAWLTHNHLSRGAS